MKQLFNRLQHGWQLLLEVEAVIWHALTNPQFWLLLVISVILGLYFLERAKLI